MDIEEIRKIVLNEGDVLVVNVSQDKKSEYRNGIFKQIKTVFPNNIVMVTSDSLEFSIVKKGESYIEAYDRTMKIIG